MRRASATGRRRKGGRGACASVGSRAFGSGFGSATRVAAARSRIARLAAPLAALPSPEPGARTHLPEALGAGIVLGAFAGHCVGVLAAWLSRLALRLCSPRGVPPQPQLHGFKFDIVSMLEKSDKIFTKADKNRDKKKELDAVQAAYSSQREQVRAQIGAWQAGAAARRRSISLEEMEEAIAGLQGVNLQRMLPSLRTASTSGR